MDRTCCHRRFWGRLGFRTEFPRPHSAAQESASQRGLSSRRSRRRLGERPGVRWPLPTAGDEMVVTPSPPSPSTTQGQAPWPNRLRPTPPHPASIRWTSFEGTACWDAAGVNYLAGLEVTPAVLEHHNTYFSYADSILPSFLFAVGFAFRLTWCKRMERQDRRTTISSYLRRCSSLVIVSLILSGIGGGFSDWSAVDAEFVGPAVVPAAEGRPWEVLAIIGVTQLCLLPLVGRSTAVRVVAMLLSLVAHVGLSYAFNFAFVLGLPNAVDRLLGTTGQRCWDGGLFGLISWSFLMLAGTVAYDLVRRFVLSRRAVAWLFAGGVACCAAGYALNCVGRLYDDQGVAGQSRPYAESPVWPPWSALTHRSVPDLLAEPPLVPVPDTRPWNYWLMSKRLVSGPFVLFATAWRSWCLQRSS